MNLAFCNICNVTQIWERKPNGKIQTNQYYCEISLILSNETHMRQAICTNCYNNLTQEDVDNLFEKIKQHWKNENSELKYIDNLKVETYSTTEDDAKEKYKKIKEDKHKEKLEKAKQEKEKTND